MKHILYIAFLFAGFVCWGQSDEVTLSFEDVYQDLFDSTVTETEFVERLELFYIELDNKKVLSTDYGISETREGWYSIFEDSLRLSAGYQYHPIKEDYAHLKYRDHWIVDHRSPRRKVENISWEVMNPEDDKKEHIAIPVVSDSIHSFSETIYNYPEGIKVTFDIKYKGTQVPIIKLASMTEITHSTKEILEISNVRFTAINEDE
ncbi:MAG: hypothetical protein ACFHU9_09850 [Fluviicola sp.]